MADKATGSGEKKPSIFDLEPGSITVDSSGERNSEGINKPEKAAGAVDAATAFAASAGAGADPAAPYGYKKDGTPAKPRGRKPGTGAGYSGASRSQTKAARETAQDLTGAVSQVLVGIHGMLAVSLKSDHWKLEEKEAQEVEKAILRVQNAYAVTVDPRTSSLIGLASILSMVYGPRVVAQYAISKRKDNSEPQPQRQPQSPQSRSQPMPKKADAKSTPKPNGTLRPGDVPVSSALTPGEMFGPGFSGGGPELSGG